MLLIFPQRHLLIVNMKLITAIYLNCRPELRDEWLATMEIEEAKDSPTNVEMFLRRLVAFCWSPFLPYVSC